jgi:hypothetical protein
MVATKAEFSNVSSMRACATEQSRVRELSLPRPSPWQFDPCNAVTRRFREIPAQEVQPIRLSPCRKSKSCVLVARMWHGINPLSSRSTANFTLDYPESPRLTIAADYRIGCFETSTASPRRGP